jgi:CelD/BcsL family acetyltransferase involved in cellulose biosynthesis
MSENSASSGQRSEAAARIEGSDRCSVEWIATLDDLKRVSSVWNPLLQGSQSVTVFLTWQWLGSWVERFLTENRTLFVLCVRLADEVVGIAPWYIETVQRGALTLREVRFLGSPESGSDYLDVILQEGKERAAAEALFEFLFGKGRQYWDELRLTDLPAESLFLLHFLNVAEKHGKFAELRRHAYLPQTPLPDTGDAFLASLSSNRRYIFGRDMRRLAKEWKCDHVTYRGEEIERGLTRFFALYDEKSGYDDGPRLAPFLRTLSAQPDAGQWVQVDMLTIGDRDIGGLLHLRFGENLAMLKMVVDKTFSRRISIGNLLVGMSIQRAITSGATCYDFLKGDEEYKFHWAKRGRVTLSIIMPQRRWKPLLMTGYRLLKYLGKAILR